MPKKNFPYVVSVDWLQLYCYCHGSFADAEKENWRLRVKPYPTAQFLDGATFYVRVENKWVPSLEILFNPRHDYMPANAMQVRVRNERLYTSCWLRELYMFQELFKVEFRSISRIDLAADFNRFYNGLMPQRLIRGYVEQKILKIGINCGYLSFGSMGYVIPNGSTAAPAGFKVGSPLFNGITWGSKGYVQTQLYDKSKEMRDVKCKPWIIECWNRAGLDVNSVWRLEIRVQKKGLSLQHLDSGDLFGLGICDLSDADRIRELFMAYADKYARFVKRDYHVKKQQMTPIKLFSEQFDAQRSVKPKIATKGQASNRTVKTVRNYLDGLLSLDAQGLTVDKDPQLAWHVNTVKSFLQSEYPRLDWEVGAGNHSAYIKEVIRRRAMKVREIILEKYPLLANTNLNKIDKDELKRIATIAESNV